MKNQKQIQEEIHCLYEHLFMLDEVAGSLDDEQNAKIEMTIYRLTERIDYLQKLWSQLEAA